MLSTNVPPLPIETVRDLLGIARALYRAWGKSGPEFAKQRRELVAIGLDLKKAIELAKRGGPESVENAASWERAERATKALGMLVDAFTGMKPAIEATARELSDVRTRRRRASGDQ